jgi:aspartyl aminopeptidase
VKEFFPFQKRIGKVHPHPTTSAAKYFFLEQHHFGSAEHHPWLDANEGKFPGKTMKKFNEDLEKLINLPPVA